MVVKREQRREIGEKLGKDVNRVQTVKTVRERRRGGKQNEECELIGKK